MISVCLCTYNGQKYIKEQLQTLRKQKQPADEVIIYDDASTDHTVIIIRDFLDKHNLWDTWRLVEAEQNIGWPRSFYYAMSLCEGDIVFLADQDDIWDESKIEVMSGIMEQHPDQSLLACKCQIVNEKGKPIKGFINYRKSTQSHAIRSIDLAAIFHKYEWPGMALAFRRKWFEDLCANIPLGSTPTLYTIPQDFLLVACAACDGGFIEVDATLASHRRHGENVGKEEHRVSKLLRIDRKLWEINQYNTMLDAIHRLNLIKNHECNLILEKKRIVMADRYRAIKSGKITQILQNYRRHRTYIRQATFFCDLVIGV
ncbi:MAG: glycosyltransferase, partial [Lachnospiraceae bacterium]|nr:glycosyltransferase [Lachnospiraceae bacterium]